VGVAVARSADSVRTYDQAYSGSVTVGLWFEPFGARRSCRTPVGFRPLNVYSK
jgi:hypothetical protein